MPSKLFLIFFVLLFSIFSIHRPCLPCPPSLTELSEIGREQFCAQYHRDSLRDMAFSAARNKIATCGANSIKIIDMTTWKVRVSQRHQIFVRAVDICALARYLCAADSGRYLCAADICARQIFVCAPDI
jgi:hypothetical protein